MLNFLKEFFSFSKKELNGLLVLNLLILGVALAPYIYAYLNPPEIYDYSAFAKEVALFRASAENEKADYYSYDTDKGVASVERKFSPQLFSFNPNGLDASLWKKLGLSDRQIKVIKNYESKGGRFYHKEDLKKIYSIRPEEYAILEPYINIPQNEYKKFDKAKFEKEVTQNSVKAPLELNGADSAALEALSGIGPSFAIRIIKYRNRLGGFHTKEQIREVYGLDSTIYEKMEDRVIVNQAAIHLIHINTASFEELKHPYLSYKQINAILQYRKQHGAFKTPGDLKAIVVLDQNTLMKITPYLAFE